jgi:aspartate carbamoyltransferase catalytic subunit
MVGNKFNPKESKLEQDPLESDGLNPDPESLIREDNIDLKVLSKLVGQR